MAGSSWDSALGPRVHELRRAVALVDFGARTWSTLVDSLPAVELTVIEDAAHYAWLDRPDRFTSVLLRALRGDEAP